MKTVAVLYLQHLGQTLLDGFIYFKDCCNKQMEKKGGMDSGNRVANGQVVVVFLRETLSRRKQ